MAVNAIFKSDFSSFYDAVQKAEVSLKGFDDDAAKVGRSLSNMANQFSGQKVVQDATMMTKAIAEIGGATALTDTEMKKVNATVTEAIKKYDALGKEAPADMRALAKATDEAAQAAKKIEPPLTMGQRAASLLGSSFAQFTAAGLATTAIQKLTSGVMEFVDIGTRMPAIQGAFDRLTTGIGQNGQQMLGSMQTATKGMVSQFDLMQSANKAMLLGLPVTSSTMGELSDAAVKLGKAMGQDATKSLDDMITALGRSSPMILDNLGLSVKVGEANEAYASKLGKTAEALTDAEKKTAFYEAAMEAARKKTKELGEQTMTLGEIAGVVWTGFGDQVSTAASTVNVSIGAILTDWNKFKIFAAATASGDVVGAMKLIADMERLKATVKETGDAFVGPVDVLGKYQSHLDAMSSMLEPLTERQLKLAKAGLAAGDSAAVVAAGIGATEAQVKALDESQKKATTSAETFKAAMVELNAAGVGWQGTLDSIDGETVEAIKFYLAAGVAQNDLATAYGLTAVQVKAVASAYKDEVDALKFLADFEKKTHETAMAMEKTLAAERSKQLADRNKETLDSFNLVAKLQQENTDYLMKQSMTETEFKVAKIREWEAATLKSLAAAGMANDTYTAAVKTNAQNQIDALQGVNDIVTVIGMNAEERAAAQKKAATDLAAHQTRAARETGDSIVGEFDRQAAAFEQFKGVVVAGTGQMIVTSEALRNVMNKNMETLSDYIERDYQMQQAQRDRGEFFVPGMSTNPQPGLTGWRAGGGPVSAGGTYMVGEHGPELFRPSSSGTIVPNGAGVVLNNTFYINGSVKDLAPQLIDELTRLMKQTRQWPTA